MTAEAMQADARATPSLGRVMLVTASVGSGHTRAAEAIAASVRALADAGRLTYDRIEVVDILAHATPWFRSAYRGAYLGLLERAPTLLGWLYRRTDHAYRGVRTRWATAHPNLRRMRRLLDGFAPATVVCTHFLASEYLAGLRRRGRLRARLATVVTDSHVHGMWLSDPCDRYFVANEESRRVLELAGVARGIVRVTGIPIDPVFAALPDRAAARRRHALPDDVPVVLFTTGGACVGPVGELFGALLRLTTPCVLIAVCGRSDEARRALERRLADRRAGSPVEARVLGFTSVMHELMAASDVLVGKPGGLTSSEARACGLPMAIVHAVPGQEEHNAAALLEAGCAIRCTTAPSAAWRIDQLLRRPDELARMARNARRGAMPRAGAEIAQALAETWSAAPTASPA